MIQIFKPSMGEEELSALKKVFESGFIGLGPKTAEFEENFAKYVNAPYAIGVNSGTAALHISLAAFGINSGEVLVPSLTFVSTALAPIYNNAKPVFVDVYEDTLCMSIEDLQEKITDKTKAIIPVHYGGHPCDMDAIMEIARDKKIIVIEDAAHACGAEYKGRKIGSIGDATCFSFHPVKNISTGDGGMITLENKEIAEKLKRLRWCGINKDTWQRKIGGYSWYYEVTEIGFKCHMNDIMAAIGIEQLKKLDRLNARRKEIVDFYNKAFKGLNWVELLIEKDYVKSSHWNYVIKVEERDELINFLKQNGIESGVHYMPVHLHPIFKSFTANVPVTEEVWKKIITIPLFPDLTNPEVEKVVSAIKMFKQ